MTVSLTLSGNEITDAVRLARVQGDGLENGDSSIGIWEATTNLCTNGGLESNSTKWSVTVGGGGTATIARSSTDGAKFGSWCMKWSQVNKVSWQICEVSVHNAVPFNTGAQYTVSCWMKRISGTDTPNIKLRVMDSDGTDHVLTSSTFAPSVTHSDWVRYSATFTPAIDGSTGSEIRIGFDSQAAGVWEVGIDGLQLEQQPLATPYVETNGATASRSAAVARLTSPGTYITKDQGWIAGRVRTRATEPLGGAGFPRAWQIDATPGRYALQYDESFNRWIFQQIDNASVQHNVNINRALADEVLTLIHAWTATTVFGSINGSAFSTVAAGTSAAFSTDLYIGDSPPGSQQLNQDFFCFACGTGTLSDADAALIHDLMDTQADHMPADFPGTCTMVWHCNDAIAYVPGDDAIRGRGTTGTGD